MAELVLLVPSLVEVLMAVAVLLVAVGWLSVDWFAGSGLVVGVVVTPGVVDVGVSMVGGAAVVDSIAGSIPVDVDGGAAVAAAVDDDDAVRSIPCWAPVVADDNGDGGIVDSWCCWLAVSSSRFR